MNNIRLISAGAGSGKTYRLTNELFGFLDPNGRYKYHPGEIIATTFTRMAAGELRDRVRRKILETGHHEIVDQLDQTLIGTVHSVGGQLLVQFSFEGGLSPSLNVIEDQEKQVLFNLSLTEVISGAEALELDYLSNRFSKSADDIRNEIAGLVDKARVNGMEAGKLESEKQRSVNAMLDILPEPNVSMDEINREFLRRFPDLEGGISAAGDSTNKTVIAYEALKRFVYTLEHYSGGISWYEWAKICKLNPGIRSGALFDYFIESAKKHVASSEFQVDLRRYISFVFDNAIHAMQLYQDYKRQRGVVDFADQEAEALALLDNEDVRKRFAQQYKVLLVDEFQDTSPIQLALFLKIAGLVQQVVWVGDPKQAIYGFRGTDSSLIMAVVKKLGVPEEKDILSQSRRSRPDLVAFVNDVFLEALGNKPEYPRKDQIALRPYRKSLDDKGLDPALQLWKLYWNTNLGRFNKEIFNRLLTLGIKTFLDEGTLIEDPLSAGIREVKPGDIAVLCATNQKCLEVANALREGGIEATVADTGLHRTAEARLFLACLKMLYNPGDSLARAEIAWLTGSDYDMGNLIDNRLEYLETKSSLPEGESAGDWLDDNVYISKLLSLRTRISGIPLSLIARIMVAELDLQKLVAILGRQKQRWSNLQSMLDYVDTFNESSLAMGNPASVAGFIAWFNDLSESDEDEQGLVINEHTVNILTYHKAKGLEWPVVIMHQLDRDRPPDLFGLHVTGVENMNLDAPLADRGLRFWPWPYTITPYRKPAGYQGFIDLFSNVPEKTEIENMSFEEDLRVLYVGMTRARDYLILPFYQYDSLPWLQKAIPGRLTEICGSEPVEYDIIRPTIHKHDPSKFRYRRFSLDENELENPPAMDNAIIYSIPEGTIPVLDYMITPSKADPVTEAKIGEYITLYPGLNVDPMVADDETTFGSCIHALLCAFDPGMDDPTALALIARLVGNFGFTENISHPALLTSIRTFYQWLEKQNPKAIHYKEYPVMAEKGQQLLSGIADLIVKSDDSILLIDYKTFPGHPDPEKNRETCEYKALSYSGQLALYKEMLEKIWPKRNVKTSIWFVFAGSFVSVS